MFYKFKNISFTTKMSFVCDYCNYSTQLKHNLKKHLSTIKPCKNINLCEYTREELLIKLYEENTKKHVCVCKKKYTYLCSLYRHQKKCELYKTFKFEVDRISVYKNEINEHIENINQMDSIYIYIDEIEKDDLLTLLKMKIDEIKELKKDLHSYLNYFEYICLIL